MSSRLEEQVAVYRTLPPEQRQQIIRLAEGEERAALAWAEHQMAIDRSPGSMAAALTGGREWQARHLDLIDKAFVRIANGERMRVLLNMPPRHGKALALDTPIPTPSGWTTMGELKVGDQVFDERGQPCMVTWTSPTWYGRPCYDVVTDSGERIVADAEHEWWASLDRRRRDKLYTTRTLAKDRAKQAMIWAAEPLQLPEADLPIDPYLLGCWLGDGDTAGGGMTGAPEDQKFLRAEFEAAGWMTTDQKHKDTRYSVIGLRTALRKAGLRGNKHVPEMYLRASAGQRLALLQGLVDTDGHIAPDGQVEFCSVKRVLAEAVQQLVRSLGGKASLLTGDATIDGRFISKKYRVMFYLANAARLPRKVLRCRSGIRANRHYVMAMRTASVPTRCIEVDSPNHLFLAGKSMIPTHNSVRAARWAPLWYLAKHPDHRVMIASYAAKLAEGHGRWIRDSIRAHGDQIGIQLRYGSQAANRFDLDGTEGGLVTAGVGGSLTGMGANVAIVDDPLKDAKDADSPVKLATLWDWWQQVINTRMEPNGSIVVIQTRWSQNDLAGRIIQQGTEGWTVLNLPAIAMEEGDPLGRKVGEPLWPERFRRRHLARFKKDVGERGWWALYQQEPRPLEGGVWKWPWITENRISPQAFRGVDLTRTLVAIDTAGGREDSDEVGLIGGGRDAAGEMYLLADRSKKMGAAQWGREACLLAIELEADAFVVESNFGGDMAAQILRQAWAELEREGATNGLLMPRIIEVTAKVGKRLRAEPIAQIYENGHVHHVGEFPGLEVQYVSWIPGMDSPDRLDAAVHLLTELADPMQEGLGTQQYPDNRLKGRGR